MAEAIDEEDADAGECQKYDLVKKLLLGFEFVFCFTLTKSFVMANTKSLRRPDLQYFNFKFCLHDSLKLPEAYL